MPVYLFRRSTRYYTRVSIPPDLQTNFQLAGRPPSKEFKYSLQTGNLREARHRSRLIVSYIHSIYATIRRGKIMPDSNVLSPEKLRRIVRKYVKDALAWEDAYQATQRLNPHEHEDRIEGLKDILWEQKAIVGEGRHKQVHTHHAEGLLENVDIKGLKRSTDEFNQLCRLLALADVKTSEVALKWLMADYSAKDEAKVLDELGVADEDAATTVQSSAAPHKKKRAVKKESTEITLGQLVSAFWKERSPTWKPRSVSDYQTCRRHLLNKLGKDRPVSSIDYYLVKNYRDELSEKGLSVSRINTYVGFVTMVLNFEMKTTRILKVNPCEALKLKDTRRKDELRAAFDLEDLTNLFVKRREYSQDRHKKGTNFWIPLLGLYTGARLEELCQLYCDQVAEVDGYWCLKIEEGYPEQSVKTSEKRIVPLHPFLIDGLGFHKWVQRRGGKGDHLWPELPRVANKYGHNFSKWFKLFKDRCGIDPTPNYKVFHSFRHTFETKLQYEEVDQRYINHLTGHSDNSESYRYGKRFMERLHDKAVLQLNWHEQLDLSHLMKSKWAG